jgi:hypothetical protein
LYFDCTLKKAELQQHELELVSIEALAPSGHLLRKVDQTVEFSFIREGVKHLYREDNGRPALDPVVLFKLLLLGYLYGVRSEGQLMQEVEVNVAQRSPPLPDPGRSRVALRQESATQTTGDLAGIDLVVLPLGCRDCPQHQRMGHLHLFGMRSR